MTTIGILGGTGPAGRGVAIRLANAGCDVVLGSRDSSRAQEVAGRLSPRDRAIVSGKAQCPAVGEKVSTSQRCNTVRYNVNSNA